VTLLLLIRHGANDWVHGRLAGWTPGVHLNDDGRSQAAATAARLATLPIDAIYTSPLDRTVETAQAIAGPRGMPLRLVEGLGEVKYGEWQGAELKELYKHELWPGVQFYPSGTRFPGGETLGEAQMRMVATLDGQNGQASLLMLNRDLDAERELALEWRDVTPTRVLTCETLTGSDLKAFNTFEQPKRVVPQRLEPPTAGARMTFKLPPRSYTVAQLAVTV